MAQRTDPPEGKATSRGPLGAAVAMIALVVVALTAALVFRAAAERSDWPPTTTIPQAVPANPASIPGTIPPLSAVTIAEITTNPDRFVGQTLTLRGEVDAHIDRRVFTISDGDYVGDNELLVLSAEPLPFIEGRTPDSPLIADDLVRLTGPVRLFDPAEAERELGVVLDDPRLSDWIGRPAIVARSLRLIPREDTAGVYGIPVSTADLVADPGAFQGRTVTATGEITQVLGPESFVLNGQVLVSYAQGPVPDRAPAVGQFVFVNGQFRQFDLAAFEQEIGRDLPDDTFAPFNGQPAIVVSTIRPAR